MKKITLTVLFILALLLSSCSDEETTEINPLPQPERYYSIIGEWEWVSSYNGWAGGCTPEMVGTHLSLTFIRNDSVIIQDNDTTFRVPYYIKTDSSWYTGRIEKILYVKPETDFITSSTYMFFTISPYSPFNHFIIFKLTDTLYLEEECCDCSSHTFIRNYLANEK